METIRITNPPPPPSQASSASAPASANAHGDGNGNAEQDKDTDYRPVNWKRVFFRPKYLVWWLTLIAVIVLTVLMTIHHDQVVAHLLPFSQKVRALPGGWVIPIVILIVISFPPLFGHEILALLCGVVYGLWIGFGIVAAGTFIGEIGTWFAFQYFLRKKAEKLERTNLNYGALARLTRDGGFWIVLVIRFSAIPSHFCTAVFSTCGVNFWFFVVATFLTLPKQIFLVYLGVLLVESKPSHSAKDIVFCIAFAITVFMAVYIWYKMRIVKKVLLEEQAQRRARMGLTSPSPVPTKDGASVRSGDVDDQWLLDGQAQRERDFEMVSREGGQGGGRGGEYRGEYQLGEYQGVDLTEGRAGEYRERGRTGYWV